MYQIGIDLGGTKIEGVLMAADAPDADPLLRIRRPTEAERGYRHILQGIVSLCAELRAQLPLGAPLGIGIGTPGAISPRTGQLRNSNTQCLNGQPLQKDLETALGMPIVLENDANCFALAETVWGAARGYDRVFGVILGTGVGGGIVEAARIVHGKQGIAGEWGHMRLDPAGPVCYCGGRGCVETFLSGPAGQQAYQAHGGEAEVRLSEVFARARIGEAIAQTTINRYLQSFGLALANLINILDPDVVVLGGGLSAIPELYTLGREAIAQQVFNDEFLTPIIPNQLGDSAGVFGAALLVNS